MKRKFQVLAAICLLMGVVCALPFIFIVAWQIEMIIWGVHPLICIALNLFILSMVFKVIESETPNPASPQASKEETSL